MERRARRRAPHALRTAGALLALAPAAGADPAVEITGLPAYAVPGLLAGTASGVDPATHRVAIYIQIEGAGWWSKPSEAEPSVPIQPDGTFSADVASGGLDDRATIYCAALIEASTAPPVALGAGRIPAGLPSLALTCQERYGRTLVFANRTWAVKEAPLPVGPGDNVFSDRPEDVFVDAEVRLHLRVAFHDGCHLGPGCWWSAEVILLERLGHGIYAFQTESDLAALDVNATAAGFFWDPYGDAEAAGGSPHREFDVEDGRWGNAGDPTNSQFVVQPFATSGNLHRYTLPTPPGIPALTRIVVWRPDRIRFVALTGHHPPRGFPPAAVVASHLYLHDPGAGHVVPDEGRAAFRLSLWLNNEALGGPGPPQPAAGGPLEVVFSGFSFRPLAAEIPALPGAWPTIALLALALAPGAALPAWRAIGGGAHARRPSTVRCRTASRPGRRPAKASISSS